MKTEDIKIELFDELSEMILGDKLGSGYSRTVFEYAQNADFVVKVAESPAGRRNNILEQHIWSQVQYMDLAKWFAPVNFISSGGNILLMERAKFPSADKYPKEIPHFFTDLKYDNYGFIDKQFVSVDYAGLIITAGISNRMKKVDWDEWCERE